MTISALRAQLTTLLEDDNDDDADDWAARRLALARAVAARPELAELDELDATFGCFEREPLEALLASPHLTGLRRLVLGRDTGRAAIRAIAAAHARLPALRELCCFPEAAAVGDDGAAVLAASPLLGQLEVLELWGTGIGPDGAAALLAAPLPRLRHLALAATSYETNPIGPRGAAALARARFGALHTLELGGAALEDTGLLALAGAPGLATVEVLDLDANRLTDCGLLALAQSPHAHQLAQLSIRGNQASPAAIAALERLPRMARLHADEA